MSIPHVLMDPNTIIYEVPDLRAIYMLTDVDRLGRAFAHIIVDDPSLFRRPDLAHKALDKFFNHYHINRITGITPVTKPLALRFARGLGFVPEGILRKSVCYNGTWVDAVVHGLLREEWDSAQAPAHRGHSLSAKID
jgi:hypothetical protein